MPDGEFEHTGVTDGWLILPGPDYAGAFNPLDTQVPAVPDGSQVAYAGIGGSLTQTLSSAPIAGTIYRLQVEVGRRLDGSNDVVNGQVRLSAGTTILLEEIVTSVAEGGWVSVDLSYEATVDDPALGPLEIRLYAPTPGGSQMLFDDVRLSALTPQAADYVTICHKPGTKAEKTLNIALKGWENGHSKHGDTLGECPSS